MSLNIADDLPVEGAENGLDARLAGIAGRVNFAVLRGDRVGLADGVAQVFRLLGLGLDCGFVPLDLGLGGRRVVAGAVAREARAGGDHQGGEGGIRQSHCVGPCSPVSYRQGSRSACQRSSTVAKPI